MKEKLNLLAQLTTGKLVDGSGLPVSPHSRVEIGCYPKALELRKRMMEVEDAKCSLENDIHLVFYFVPPYTPISWALLFWTHDFLLQYTVPNSNKLPIFSSSFL